MTSPRCGASTTSQSPKQNNIELFTGASLADNRQVYFDASPISYAIKRHNKVAVHLSVGTEDDLVDRRAHTDAFVLALKQAGFFVRTTILQGAPHYWGSDPIDEPNSFSGFLAPRLMRFLAGKTLALIAAAADLDQGATAAVTLPRSITSTKARS